MVFGEILVDIFPDRAVLGGAPFNVARHLKAFGQNPILISKLGNDALRSRVIDAMEKIGMEIIGIQCSHRYPTGQVKVHLEKDRHRFEILPLQAYDFIHPSVARKATLSANPVLIYFGTLAQRNEVSRRALKALLKGSAAAKFLDINLRTPWYDEKILWNSLQSADIVKLNNEELYELAKIFDLSGENEEGQACQLMSRFDLERVMVTSGEEGAWQINRHGRKVEVKVKSKIGKLVDTVGAGDGFAAVSILGVLRQWPVDETLERANEFAAAICGIRGAVPEEADFYNPFIEGWHL